MDKKKLVETLENAGVKLYNWSLYFFKIDRRNSNPYIAYKIRFKNDIYLSEYAKSLINMIVKYQLEKVDNITDYTGENTKVSCDKIEISNELIREQWNYLVMSVINASDEKVEGKYQGYILEGVPANSEEKTVVFLKVANPIIKIKNKRNVVFTFDENSELIDMTDEVCKLHMDADCVVFDEIVYTFNYKFEDLFNIEKTMQRVKNKALDEMISIDAFDNREEFERMARSYKSPRTFVTLKSERVERIRNRAQRKKVANMLKIDLNDKGKFIFKNEEEVSLLIRYLCFKVFKDDETKELLEANNITRLNI